ncbi:MAG: YfbU family protein [Candidatus Paceibacterota bacterium]
MKLDKKERLLLYNQFKILKKLEPNEADSYERYCNILQGGYKKHYRNFIEDFSEELPKSISDEVYKILEMFRNIHDSINRLSKSEKKELDLFKLQFQ